MKLSITGHTSGVGKAIYDAYTEKGHECLGFSRTSGYDISEETDRAKIIAESADCIVFINNACTLKDNSQFLLLKDMYESWKGKDKLIINMGMKLTDKILPEDHFLFKYREKKLEQELFCLNKSRWPWVLNIKASVIDTPMTRFVPKLADRPDAMTTDAIVTVIDFAIKNRAAFRTTSITIGL